MKYNFSYLDFQNIEHISLEHTSSILRSTKHHTKDGHECLNIKLTAYTSENFI